MMIKTVTFQSSGARTHHLAAATERVTRRNAKHMHEQSMHVMCVAAIAVFRYRVAVCERANSDEKTVNIMPVVSDKNATDDGSN